MAVTAYTIIGENRCGICAHFEPRDGAALGTCWRFPPAPIKSDKGEILWLHCRVSPGDGCGEFRPINKLERERLAYEEQVKSEMNMQQDEERQDATAQ